MPSTHSSLILGAATRIPPSYVSPFVESLRAVGYAGRLGFVLGQYGPAERSELEQLADITVWADDTYTACHPRTVGVLARARSTRRVRRAYPNAFRLAAAVGRPSALVARRQSLEYRLEGLQSLRYQHYLRILEERATDADQVMLTDLRDVLFQNDPFAEPLTKLEVFLEEPVATLGADPHNRRWIRDLYGKRELDELRGYVTSCSGTVIGPRRAILNYLRQMSAAAASYHRPLGSHDQAVHNYLLRRGQLGPETMIVENGFGRVLTMGHMTTITRDSTGRVLNADDSVPAVLHQYDRHPDLARELLHMTAASS